MRSSDINPKKSLGQNFLVNQGVLDKIVGAAEISPEDTVIEVGPGRGALTRKLSGKSGQVVAVEKDRRLIKELQEKFVNSNVEIVEADILKFDPTSYELKPNSYKIVANIPYYITSNFLRTVFEKWPAPKLIVLTIQKEVAKRIVAKKGEMSLLALSVQLYSDPEIIMTVSRNSFRPAPNVDSAVIRLVPNAKTDKPSVSRIMAVARKAFAGKRKQIKNTLAGTDFSLSGVSPSSRPEDLDIKDWLELISTL